MNRGGKYHFFEREFRDESKTDAIRAGREADSPRNRGPNCKDRRNLPKADLISVVALPGSSTPIRSISTSPSEGSASWWGAGLIPCKSYQTGRAKPLCFTEKCPLT